MPPLNHGAIFSRLQHSLPTPTNNLSRFATDQLPTLRKTRCSTTTAPGLVLVRLLLLMPPSQGALARAPQLQMEQANNGVVVLVMTTAVMMLEVMLVHQKAKRVLRPTETPPNANVTSRVALIWPSLSLLSAA